MTSPLIDARAAGERLGVPHTWLLREARRDAVPHVRLGRYVRFDPDQLLAWAHNRARGPAYPVRNKTQGGPGAVAPARGPTPAPWRTDAS